MSRLVCVSNRITVPKRTAAPGGLAVGVLQALRASGGLWFGWGGNISDGEPPATPELLVRDGITYATIDLTRDDFDRYYSGYANDILWPLFHYFVKDFHFSRDNHAAYQRVNHLFAARLLSLLRPGDRVWVHDYHLIPLARCLRELGWTGPVGFFLHIPFPGIEVLRILPAYRELLRDLVTYDVAGFHTDNDLAAFRSGVRHLFGSGAIRDDGRIVVDGHSMQADVFPIGVDVDAVQASAAAAAGTEVVKRMVASLAGRHLMIGVDRLDYSKGLVERFAAYERFLETHPASRGRITYIQIAPISRGDVRAYAEIRRQLEQATGRTNGRFADTDWTPIRYLNRNFPHATLMGFLRAADVALVTPLRDGMNLVVKEFVAAQDPADPGVPVLSSLAGAARELDAALLVNPYDLQAVSDAMQAALTMPLPERRERHEAMLAILRRNDIATWARRFVTALETHARH